MKRAIIRTSDLVDAALLRVAIVALALLVGTVVLQVVARYVFFQPPVWTEEIARYLMIWAGLLGATLAFKRHFDPAIFQPKMGPRAQRLVLTIQSVAILIFVLPALFYCFVGPGLRVTRGFLMRHSKTYSETLDIATIYVAVAVPLALAVILLHLAARWAGETKKPLKG
jgi:TRAP-type C4-dicarboxylate transport system permease small subunit